MLGKTKTFNDWTRVGDYMKGNPIDLTNQKIGKLSVIRQAEKINNKTAWVCQCECGNEIIVSSTNLSAGHTKSCGCLKAEKSRQAHFKDLTGQKFGRLTVIKETDQYVSPQGNKYTRWLCRCDCGNEATVLSCHLSSGAISSCGCYSAELTSQLNAKNLIGERFGKLTVVDKADDELQKTSLRLLWKCICDCGNECIKDTNSLTMGNTISCGCLHSQGEFKLTEIFKNHNIQYETQKKFDDLRGVNDGILSYDFYLPNYNLLIEYQGVQHYEPIDFGCGEIYAKERYVQQQEHDKRKREYAEKNGYRLLEIPYYNSNNMEEILNTMICGFKAGNS